jgi:hypothetical protein
LYNIEFGTMLKVRIRKLFNLTKINQPIFHIMVTFICRILTVYFILVFDLKEGKFLFQAFCGTQNRFGFNESDAFAQVFIYNNSGSGYF